ncbi:MAG: c-type cytochrome biogenesis protein CcmI [Sideroxyarcus sp.]|nr:c-type cytochrome biogenesis protein CcmI [Sideroxyarcus sp.]
MILFWLICAALLIVAVLFVALPLWRGRPVNDTVERDAANLQILRDQLTELETDLKNGLLAPELYQQGKRELESRVLEEVAGTGQTEAGTSARPFRALAIVMSAMLVILALGVYLAIGTPNAFSPTNPHAGVSDFGGTVRTDNAIAELESKVAADPADATSLVMLARSYMEADRYAESAKAYADLVKLVPDEAWVWADYADAEAMAQGGQSLRGKPTELLNKALALDPNSMKGLALAGSAAMERGDYAVVIKHWERLRELLPADSEHARTIDEGLQEVRQRLARSKDGKAPLAEQVASAAGKERISGMVSLDTALQGQYSPDDTVFVLARAAQGPKIPLAILRKQVRDLPLTFELDDSTAMTPQTKLSAFDQVVVVARISRAGTAMPAAGDAEGSSQPLRPGSKNVNVKIDNIVQ